MTRAGVVPSYYFVPKELHAVTYQELPPNNAKCSKTGEQKGRAKRAPLLLGQFFELFPYFLQFSKKMDQVVLHRVRVVERVGVALSREDARDCARPRAAAYLS